MSKKYVIIVDSTCDVDEELQKQYDIEILPAHYVGPDGVEKFSYPNWNELNREEFWDALKKNPEAFKTAPPSPEEARLVFKSYVEKGEDVIALCLSSGLSGNYAFMEEGAKAVREEFPEAKVHVVDTLRFGPAAGLLAIHGSFRRAEGKSFEETVEWLENNKNHFHQTGWMDDLKYLAKKGRITNAKAFFGQLIGIKPIGEFDYNGMTTVIGKGKGEAKTYPLLLEYMAEHIIEPEKQIIFVATSNEHKQAEVFRQMIEERFHPKAVVVKDVHVGCGINIGPGLMAAYYYGKPISKGVVEETAKFKEIQERAK